MFFLRLKFGPSWKDISIVRNFIISMLASKITDYTGAYRVGLVASELLENACKYSRIGGAAIEIEQNGERPELILRIKNITDRERIRQFKKIHALIYKESAKSVYKNMMLRSLARGNSKQLGLARIRYEGQAEISFSVEKDIDFLLHSGAQLEDSDGELAILCVQIKTAIIPETADRREL